MLIKVLQRDIDTGEREMCVRCPVALALNRHGFFDALVFSNTVRLVRGAQRTPLPPKVTSFINRFDKGKPVQPFEFELPVPDPRGAPPDEHSQGRAA